MNKILEQKIDKFLSEKRLSHGGYSEVTKDDMVQLRNIIDDLLEIKWQRDPDGDLPVEFTVMDKTTYRIPDYWPIRHYRSDNTDKELFESLRIAGYNLSLAHGDLEVILSMIRMRQEV